MSTPSKTPFLDAVAEISGQAEDVKHATFKLLRSRGWEYTSSTPGCFWMWQKTLPDGRTILTDDGTALLFEQDLCGEEPEPIEGGAEG